MATNLSRISGINFVHANSDNKVVSGVAKNKASSTANGAVLNTQLQTFSSSGNASVASAPVLTAPTAALDAPKVKNRLENLSGDISSIVASVAALIALGVDAATNHKSESPEDVIALMGKDFANTFVQLANDVINVASDSVPDGSSAGTVLDTLSSELSGSLGDGLVSVISGISQMPKYISNMIADINNHSQASSSSANLPIGKAAV